jgi:inosine/xanthosine triphosphate pyrophosphatase family protein
MTLLFATTNPNKLREVRPLFGALPVELKTLADVGAIPEPEESGRTFWENARIKAFAYAQTGWSVVAEDSGLEIAALDGQLGVQSARFLGTGASYPELAAGCCSKPKPGLTAKSRRRRPANTGSATTPSSITLHWARRRRS